METICNGISVEHKYSKGCLGGPKRFDLDVKYQNYDFAICINQFGSRKITITSCQQLKLGVFWGLYTKFEMLLMLLEGNFIPITSGKIINKRNEAEDVELTNLIHSRVDFYESADYTIGDHGKFCDFEKVLTPNVFAKWINVVEELDILHTMFLYTMANTGITIDFKCAIMIESFEALAELVNEKNPLYSLPVVAKGESKLGKYLLSIIRLYGIDLFKKELETLKEGVFISLLVDNRNRFAHIKSKQGRIVLTGQESILYAVKLAYLYRITILSLIDINYDDYVDKVNQSINAWDAWQGVLDNFLVRLRR